MLLQLHQYQYFHNRSAADDHLHLRVHLAGTADLRRQHLRRPQTELELRGQLLHQHLSDHDAVIIRIQGELELAHVHRLRVQRQQGHHHVLPHSLDLHRQFCALEPDSRHSPGGLQSRRRRQRHRSNRRAQVIWGWGCYMFMFMFLSLGVSLCDIGGVFIFYKQLSNPKILLKQ